MRLALAVVVLCIASSAAAPGMDLAKLPSDTQWFLRLDAKAALAGQLGMLVRDLAARPAVQPKLAALTLITGFDPLADLDTALLAGSAAGDQAAVLFLEGRFAKDRLITLVKAAEDYAADQHGAVTIHRWRDHDKPGKPLVYAAFLEDGLLAIGGGEVAVGHAVDSFAGATRFAAPTVPSGAGLLAWGQADDFAKLAAGNAQAAFLSNVRQATVSIRERDSALVGEVNLTAVDAATADQLAKLATGLLALSQLGKNAGHGPLSPALLSSVRIDSTDRTVTLSASCPFADLRDIQALQTGR